MPATTATVSTKSCAAKGHRECVRGFHRDECHNCTNGSVACNACRPGAPSSASCIFCFDGQKECDDCCGLGFVQRICQDCIKEHYRRQGAMTKANGITASFGSAMSSNTTLVLGGGERDLDEPNCSSACSHKSSTKSSQKSLAMKLSKVTLSLRTAAGAPAHRRKWSRSAFSSCLGSLMLSL